MSIYTDKMAHLVSLIEQLKRYPFDDLHQLLETTQAEDILNRQEIAGRNWEKEPPLHQKTFLHFLNTYILTYEKALQQLKEKTLPETETTTKEKEAKEGSGSRAGNRTRI